MISQAAEYALRAVVCLASNPAHALTTARIADDTAIPPGYLAKIMNSLVRAGIVTSRRGLNGGFILTPDPRTLTLMDIVRAVDPSHRIATCPVGNPDHKDNLCPLHRQLDAAAARAEQVLEQMTIHQAIAPPENCQCSTNLQPETAILSAAVLSAPNDLDLHSRHTPTHNCTPHCKEHRHDRNDAA